MTMPTPVRITFLQDVNTWEGYFHKGSVAECAEEIAKEWVAQGLVAIDAPPAATDAKPDFQPSTETKAAGPTKPNHARANRTR